MITQEQLDALIPPKAASVALAVYIFNHDHMGAVAAFQRAVLKFATEAGLPKRDTIPGYKPEPLRLVHPAREQSGSREL